MYTSALNLVCGVIDPPLANTMPRSTSSLPMPRSSRPALSPAMPSLSCFLNISTPVTTVFRLSAPLPLAALDSPREHRAAARDRKNIFDRHQERLVQLACRLRHALVRRL